MASNYLFDKKVYAIRKQKEKELLAQFPELKNESGVYIWFKPTYKVYIGQARNILKRTIDHCTQHNGHLDNSIYKHKLYHPIKNKNGWKIIPIPCPLNEMDSKEQELIDKYKNNEDYELYNISGGGQGEERIGDIAERKARKGYSAGLKKGCEDGLKKGFREGFKKGFKDGTKQGYENCKREVLDFMKYLFVLPNEDYAINEKKVVEFENWLKERGNYENEKDK